MPDFTPELVSPMSLVLLQPVVAAIGSATPMLRPMASLPAPCVWLEETRTLACATPVLMPDLYRAEMVSAAAIERIDIITVRHGMHPETLDPVSIDVVLGRDRSPRMLWAMVAFRAPDGGFWFVPPLFGQPPSVRVDAHGLTLSAEPPYADADERGDGIGRAARETVLALRALRRG